MIIATAGHVDHGKTLLVKALTGVDTDRLPEEKRRNLTIDLGFAYLPIAGHETIGFIDVPGHERFIRNALCGLAGTDFVLLVVAADDGPMPQTAEHLAIIDLLGIGHGAVVITKADRVSPHRLELVRGEISDLLEGTTLESAARFSASALTGDGIEALLDHLIERSMRMPPRATAGKFRLAIDRTFDIVGAGFVVTGTVFAGTVRVGDVVRIAGHDSHLRVRGIHAQNAPVEIGSAGQRCAINLTGPGLRKQLIARGDWLAAEDVPPPVTKFDAEVRLLPRLEAPLRNWAPVHVHLGAADATGRIAVLEGGEIAPGAKGLVQIVLDRPIGALCGDHLIVRDQSAQFTLGGGRALDIFPPRRGRAKPARLAQLRAGLLASAPEALTTLLAEAAEGVDLKRFATNRNLTAEEMAGVEMVVAMTVVGADGSRFGFAHHLWQDVRRAAIARIEAYHQDQPASLGIAEKRVMSGSGFPLALEVQTAVVAELVREGAVVKTDHGLRLPSHQPRLAQADARLWERIEGELIEAAPKPLAARDLALATGLDGKRIEALLTQAARLGLVHFISTSRVVLPEELQRLAGIVERIAMTSNDRSVSVAELRDASGIGRNMSVEIMEHFDKQRFTERVGDRHIVLRPAEKLFR